MACHSDLGRLGAAGEQTSCLIAPLIFWLGSLEIPLVQPWSTYRQRKRQRKWQGTKENAQENAQENANANAMQSKAEGRVKQKPRIITAQAIQAWTNKVFNLPCLSSSFTSAALKFSLWNHDQCWVTAYSAVSLTLPLLCLHAYAFINTGVKVRSACRFQLTFLPTPHTWFLTVPHRKFQSSIAKNAWPPQASYPFHGICRKPQLSLCINARALWPRSDAQRFMLRFKLLNARAPFMLHYVLYKRTFLGFLSCHLECRKCFNLPFWPTEKQETELQSLTIWCDW